MKRRIAAAFFLSALAAPALAEDMFPEDIPPGDAIFCHPVVVGDPKLARADALMKAGKFYVNGGLRDRGSVCESFQEGYRAALVYRYRFVLLSSAEGKAYGSEYVLTMADAVKQTEIASRTVLIPYGADPLPQLEDAVWDLIHTIVMLAWPQPAAAPKANWEPWVVVSAGIASIVVGIAFAAAADSSAHDRDRATTPAGYLNANQSMKSQRTISTVALVTGGLGVGVGLTWRLAF